MSHIVQRVAAATACHSKSKSNSSRHLLEEVIRRVASRISHRKVTPRHALLCAASRCLLCFVLLRILKLGALNNGTQAVGSSGWGTENLRHT